MKDVAKKFIVSTLANESFKILKKQKPEIIAITGNVGKTTTKDYISTVLKYKFGENVRSTEKSQNSEFGVALTIFGEKNAWNSFFGWLKIITVSYFKNLTSKTYPTKLVLEVGADHPGDIKHITSFVKPDMVVLTAFQESPTHGEFFKNISQHIREKKYLVDALKYTGTIVYNSDDEIMTGLSKEKDVTRYSFGTNVESDLQILEVLNYYDDESRIIGIKIKFKNNLDESDVLQNKFLELKLLGTLGFAHAYAISAAVLIGILYGMTLSEIEESLLELELSKSRMRILKGINNSIIVDDTYNASPIAFSNALDSLSKIFIKGKKIVVLGHMAELGEKTKEAHIKVGEEAAMVSNIIILSGRHNEFYLEGIRNKRFPLEKVFLANDARDVLHILKDESIPEEDDLILLKGSQSARLEKVVVEILKEETDVKYVCRQEDEWKRR